jgi:hypothetical protein
MPVKVTITKIPEKPSAIEVEIPDACPYCGTDLTDLANSSTTIREAGFVWYSSPAYIAKADQQHQMQDAIECDGFVESFDETTMRTSYLCNECDGDLTARPEDHPTKCHCEGTTCPGAKP